MLAATQLALRLLRPVPFLRRLSGLCGARGERRLHSLEEAVEPAGELGLDDTERSGLHVMQRALSGGEADPLARGLARRGAGRSQ